MTQTDKQKAGYAQEKVVTVLERHLTPDARILQHQYLPVLNGDPGERREVDVLIEQGVEPRITRSIVEVQKRGTKPTRSEFDAWLAKMEEVGAQHLICVSEKGFTKPQMRKARQRGPTVRLLTLAELEANESPLPPALCSSELTIVTYEHLDGWTAKGQHLMKIDPKRRPFDTDSKIFKTSSGKEVSASDLADMHFFGDPKNLDELPRNQTVTVKIRFGPWLPIDPSIVSYRDFGGRWVPLEWLEIFVRLRIREVPLVWKTFRNEQIGHGDMAWLLRGSAKHADGETDVVATVGEVRPGEFRIGYAHTLSDEEAFVAVGGRGFPLQPVTNSPRSS